MKTTDVFTDFLKLKLKNLDEEIEYLEGKLKNARTAAARAFYTRAIDVLRKKALEEATKYYEMSHQTFR